MGSGAACDHRAHAVSESGKANRYDVNQNEEQKEHRYEEVNGACGLLAAQNSGGRRDRRRDGGGHGQTRPDY